MIELLGEKKKSLLKIFNFYLFIIIIILLFPDSKFV